MFHIAICDDEKVFVEGLQELLRKYEKESGNEFCISKFCDGSQLLQNYQPDFDLIFMDIQMEKLNGLKTAKTIRKTDDTVGLFFLTSLPQYVWQGYEYGAANYLLKPLKYARLKMELDRFFKLYQGKDEPYLSFSNDTGKYKVLYKNLRYAETCKRNVLLHFEGQEQIIYKNMKEIASLLETQRKFTKCHASFLVNLSYVKSVENLEAVLTTGERIPISQPKRKEFMEKLAEYWGDML